MENVIRSAIFDAVSQLGFAESDFVVEHPTDLSHGDYACNVAMVLAKSEGKVPREIAEQILPVLEGQIEYVEKIEIAGPGFINFYLARDFFTEEIARANNAGDTWGSNAALQNEVALIEYTSPNLFKPLHIGNLVGNIVGESLTRIYEFSGAEVLRLNYPSDIGLTVAKGVWGLMKTGGDPTDIAALGEAYRVGNEAYETSDTDKAAIIAVNQALYEDNDPKLSALRQQGLQTSLQNLTALCEKLGTKFTGEIFESEAAPMGMSVVQKYTGSIFEESDGAVVYKGEKVGLHTRVFINSKGLPTYEAKDLGNFVIKNDRYPNWTQYIIVTGGEQTEYFKVVFAAVKDIFKVSKDKVLTHIPTGFLTLTTGKMSSRKGNVLTGESMLRELEEQATQKTEIAEVAEVVAVAALKYQILRHSVGSNIIFDKEKSLSFEGDSGPYLQYTYARINSVLEKSAAAGITTSVSAAPDIAYAIEKILYRFPEVVEQAQKERTPHHLAGFLTELAGAFNTFYGQEKIADPEDDHAPYKLLLTETVGQTLKNGLWLLGIKAPERM